MKSCEIMEKGLCLGCVGLAEHDWIGPEQCLQYKKYKNMSGYDLFKQKMIQMKMEGLN